MHIQWKKWRRRALIILTSLFLLSGIALLVCSTVIVRQTEGRVYVLEDIPEGEKYDCVLVLGALVHPDGTMSKMLHDRVDVGIALYQRGIVKKILLSGDHADDHYNEVGAMYQYALEQGVPGEDIFLDHRGFSTYESVYRAKHVYGVESMIVSTQKYHLYRAIYLADQMDIRAIGASATLANYTGQTGRDIREILARGKDAMMCLVKPAPENLGEAISISGDGGPTHEMKAEV